MSKLDIMLQNYNSWANKKPYGGRTERLSNLAWISLSIESRTLILSKKQTVLNYDFKEGFKLYQYLKDLYEDVKKD